MRLKPRLSQNLLTFSDLVPSREFTGFGKTGFEPSRTKFRCSECYGLQPLIAESLAITPDRAAAWADTIGASPNDELALTASLMALGKDA